MNQHTLTNFLLLILVSLLSVIATSVKISIDREARRDYETRQFYHDVAAYQQLRLAQQKPVGPTATGLAK